MLDAHKLFKQDRKISWLRYVLYCVVFGNCKRLDGLMGCGMRYGILTMPNDDQEKQESILKQFLLFVFRTVAVM